jgi:hypothetical protein
VPSLTKTTSSSDPDPLPDEARDRAFSEESCLPVASIENYERVHPLPFADAEIQILPLIEAATS